jgi:NAD(P)-dependent dehydrogenase (short-subunit alcohol dehydrogenase family)
MNSKTPGKGTTGKKGLVLGIANEHSIAYGCAKAFRALGAELAITYLNDKARPFVEPLSGELGASMFLPLDVQAKGQMDRLFEAIGREWGKLDFALHSIAYAQSGSARQSYGLLARRLPQRHECVLLLIYPHGAAREVSVVMVKSVPPSFMRHHGPRQSCHHWNSGSSGCGSDRSREPA